MRLVVVIAAVESIITGCGSDPQCSAGQQIACACASGESGAQSCKDDGSGYAACVCDVISGTGGSSSSSTGAGDGAAGGAGGGGAGAGGAMVCMPGSTMPCYSGPASSLDVGACHAGTQTCDAVGASWSACVGEIVPGIEDCGTPADDDCSGTLVPCGSATTWSKRFGDAMDSQKLRSVTLDGAANVIVSGAFPGTADFGGGALTSSGNDLFLAKFAPSGAPLWSKLVPGTVYNNLLATDGLGNPVVGVSVVGPIDFGSGLVLGSDQGNDIAIVKLDPTGTPIWAKRWSTTSAVGAFLETMTTSPTGAVYATGLYYESIDVGCGPIVPPSNFNEGTFVTELSPVGDCVWSRSYAGSVTTQSIAVDATGTVFVAGNFFGNYVDFGGGFVGQNSAPYVFLEKGSATGTHLTTTFWNAGAPAATGLALNAAGDVVMTGTVTAVDFGNGVMLGGAGSTAYVVTLDTNGAALWGRALGPAQSQGHSLALDPAGNIVATGRVEGDADFGTGTITNPGGVYVWRLDAAGSTLSAAVFDNGYSSQVVVDGQANAIVAGHFVDTTDFGNGPLVSGGGSDAYLADVGQ